MRMAINVHSPRTLENHSILQYLEHILTAITAQMQRSEGTFSVYISNMPGSGQEWVS